MTDDPDDTDWKTEAERLKGELQKARKWEDRAKANATAAQRVTELEGSLQDAVARAEQAESRADTAESEVTTFKTRDQLSTWKTEISTATGVPAQYLRGVNEDELKAHADELKPLFDKRGPVVPGAADIPTNTPSDERAFARDLFGGN